MKQLISNRLVVTAMLVALLPRFVAAGHQGNAQSTAQIASRGSEDRFIGTWNAKKLRSGTVRESITIEPHETDFKFTYDWTAENGTELHWWYFTDMEGGVITYMGNIGLPLVKGKPVGKPSITRVTRLDSSSFKVESEIQRDIYKVSIDGQTMKLQRTYPFQVRPYGFHEFSSVFERQK